jgi:hypothetical protein
VDIANDPEILKNLLFHVFPPVRNHQGTQCSKQIL